MSEAPPPAPTDFRQMYRRMKTPQLISEAWENETDMRLRDQIVAALVDRARRPEEEGGGDAAWPSAPLAAREEAAGLYPDPADPEFAARLFAKREFYEARAVAMSVADGTVDPCTSAAAERVFELTPVQRIVSRFLHPLTPYQGMLLFHGVGVGKTCSAVTIAEQFLEASPTSRVFVLVPQALKDNFKRTIFDAGKLRWDAAAGEWTAQQCTGTSYLDRLGLRRNPDLDTVRYRVEEDRRSRYTITGYLAFANWIAKTLANSVPKDVTDPAIRTAAENEVLRKLFSDKLIIVDEAHNMRDVEERSEGGAGGAGGVGDAESVAEGEAAENAGGKALNPFLKRIALHAEGLRLVFMTATPMYNSAPEIVLLLNYLSMNDTKSEASALRISDIFTPSGDIRPGAPQRSLERLARRYVSYMRGENPYTFPLRMKPEDAPAAPGDMWPAISATKKDVNLTDDMKEALSALPLVFTEAEMGSPPDVLLRAATARSAATAGAGAAAETEEEAAFAAEGVAAEAAEAPARTDAMLDLRMQMANITYPNMMYGTQGWSNYFTDVKVKVGKNTLRVFTPKPQAEGPFAVDSVFAGEGLRRHAPKIARIVESVKSAKGICFAYSRYTNAGALPLAVALERAGFQRRMADGTIAPLLVNATPKVAPICAICGKHDGAEHAAGDHPFRPACYVLLTADERISPRFAGLVQQAATWPEDPEWGPLGGRVKVVIGSQVASEGLDLKCVREMHVLDAWYHLNRIDQIVGRAIRYCSHTALRPIETRLGLPAMSMNNCLIYLHALHGGDYETADMYAYRIAIEKALMVGKVQRLMKRHAWDCNLELEAITFAGLPRRIQIDAQGRDRRERDAEGRELDGYSINDRDYTTYCDYQRCRHECAVSVARTVEEGLRLDASTFSSSDARRLILEKQAFVRGLFTDQVMVPETIVQDIFSDLPWEIASDALMELLDGRRFQVTRSDGVTGFLVKKAGWLVFQPAGVTDTDIPMTLRYARAFQLRRRFMEPVMPVMGRVEEMGAGLAVAAAPARKGVKTSAAVPATVSSAMPTAAVVATDGVVAAAPKALAATNSGLLGRWAEWLAFVESRGEGPLPSTLSPAEQLWKWLLARYASVPELRYVALRWWFDKKARYADQRALYEYALAPPAGASAVVDPLLIALDETVRQDLFRSKQRIGYRIYNPETLKIDYFCSGVSEVAFSPCDSKMAALMDKVLGAQKVEFPAETGPLFGFLAAKKGVVVFKTFDNTKEKKHSTVGAECAGVSNLGEHRPRIQILHAAGRASDLAPLMLPDDEASWDGAKTRVTQPQHMYDITHQPLCLYMEFLTRIFDAHRVSATRWFLPATTAYFTGMRSRK